MVTRENTKTNVSLYRHDLRIFFQNVLPLTVNIARLATVVTAVLTLANVSFKSFRPLFSNQIINTHLFP